MSALLGLATTVGAPIVTKILARKIGADNADLVGSVVNGIAQHLGVAPHAVERMASDDPEAVADAIRAVEAISPEIVALYNSGLEYQLAALQAEQQDPLWMRAWRPLGMYMIGILWLWNVIVLHGLNAAFKIALPPIDLVVLLQLSALYMSLYMGGHTLKDIATKFSGKLVSGK